MKSARVPRDLREDVKNVQDCISVLSRLKERWTPAGRMSELCFYGNVPVPAPSAQASLKRKGGDARLDIPSIGDDRRLFPPGPQGASYHVSGQGNTSNPTWSREDGDQEMNTTELLHFPGGLGLPPYGEPSMSYMPQALGNAPWSITIVAGETGIDTSDVAMLWLQQPQSRCSDLGRYAECCDGLRHCRTDAPFRFIVKIRRRFARAVKIFILLVQ